ncbi:MAG: serine hydrolase domain-containing protein [Kordiimonas sp.]
MAATVGGTAEKDGLLDEKAPATIAEWQSAIDPRKNITLENLLQMASGLDSNAAGNRTDRLYAGGGRVSDGATEHALEAVPGTRWKYANNDTLLAIRALKNQFKTMKEYNEYPFTALLNKLGMNDTYLETDWEGNFILSSQVWTTSRDLARVGVLYLNDGVWNGERLLPEGWAQYVAAPSGPQPAERNARGPIPGYGAQFWLYNERFPDIPDDTFAARGNRGQFLVVMPSENLVMVRRGYDPAGGEGFKLDVFIEDVLVSLR